MFAINVILYGCALMISEVIMELPPLSIYDKFGQTDYKIKLEHVDVDHYNKSVAQEVKIVTFKYNRTYTACNITLNVKIDLNNEMEVIVQTYRFASNEYRLFPLRLQVNVCLAISRNLIGLGGFANCGNFTGCPLKKGKPIYICNWAPDESRFSPFIPTSKYMLEMQFMYRSTEVAVVKGYGEVYRPIHIPN